MLLFDKVKSRYEQTHL